MKLTACEYYFALIVHTSFRNLFLTLNCR